MYFFILSYLYGLGVESKHTTYIITILRVYSYGPNVLNSFTTMLHEKLLLILFRRYSTTSEKLSKSSNTVLSCKAITNDILCEEKFILSTLFI